MENGIYFSLSKEIISQKINSAGQNKKNNMKKLRMAQAKIKRDY